VGRLFKVRNLEWVGYFAQTRIQESPRFVAVFKSSLCHQLSGGRTDIELSA
jgi:hypothetical protein